MQVPPKYFNLLGLSPTGDLGPYTAYYSSRGKLVWFPKSPPLSPPSLLQTIQRNKWRMAANAWHAQTQATRDAWRRAADAARTRLTGYDLWVWYHTTPNPTAIQTLETQSGETLT